MATATKYRLPRANTAIFSANWKADSLDAVDECLQSNHNENHIAWHEERRHNHMVHHILSVHGLGATAEQVKEHYGTARQVIPPARELDETLSYSLVDREKWKIHIGDHLYYRNYLAHFEREIQAKGYIEVMHEYLFAEDERAEDMMVRLFSGLWHPWIHLGYALEFEQPCLMAEALAQIATHPLWDFHKVLLPTEKVAGRYGTKSMIEIMEDIHKDEKLMAAPIYDNLNRYIDVFNRAPDEMIKHASKYTVKLEEMDAKVAESHEVAAYSLGCCQRRGKDIKCDFFILHNLTASIFLSSICYHPSISTRTRIRLMEWKGRVDLIAWATIKAPTLDRSVLMDHPHTKDWDGLFQWNLDTCKDDSHYAKALRALAHGQKLCKEQEAKGNAPKCMVSDEMWLKVGNMLISASARDPKYVRGAGFDPEWDLVPDLEPEADAQLPALFKKTTLSEVVTEVSST
ncbi:hypothetical protein BO71DRAFT_352975 [Aspergillus ellipticus CBS 707.79]|uniref:HypA-like protein n=1 Tax=Aspergillus ellipticus CBS 707.79 TaxID=1448320 RepID=A0A319DBH1_9EURO|nr:hypothetical protein BO71DRAFT_352975 [Aspergillus ellipticus CBS 707.79]